MSLALVFAVNIFVSTVSDVCSPLPVSSSRIVSEPSGGKLPGWPFLCQLSQI